jgi:hypothetical protein
MQHQAYDLAALFDKRDFGVYPVGTESPWRHGRQLQFALPRPLGDQMAVFYGDADCELRRKLVLADVPFELSVLEGFDSRFILAILVQDQAHDFAALLDERQLGVDAFAAESRRRDGLQLQLALLCRLREQATLVHGDVDGERGRNIVPADEALQADVIALRARSSLPGLLAPARTRHHEYKAKPSDRKSKRHDAA